MHALHQVLHAFFNLHSFTLAMPDVWAGFQVNLHMMIIAEVLVLVLALAIAIVRGLPGPGARPLRALAIAYTDFFRGTPIIIVAYFIGFGLPGENAHAPNEWISVENFEKGMVAMAGMYSRMG